MNSQSVSKKQYAWATMHSKTNFHRLLHYAVTPASRTEHKVPNSPQKLHPILSHVKEPTCLSSHNRIVIHLWFCADLPPAHKWTDKCYLARMCATHQEPRKTWRSSASICARISVLKAVRVAAGNAPAALHPRQNQTVLSASSFTILLLPA